MAATVVVGMQWGDEGKGKITDLLAAQADVVVRYQGGSNAGHTVVAGERTLKLHLVPSGILHPKALCVMADGTVVDPVTLAREHDGLEQQGVSCANLRVSGNAHAILPYHMLLDTLEEESRGAGQIGTTRRGIGPAYCDKTARVPQGVRMWDLLDEAALRERVEAQLAVKNPLLQHVYGREPLQVDEVIAPVLEVVPRIADHITDTRVLLYEQMTGGARMVFEGAQGTFLDLDYGTYPYVTSSHPVAGGACLGTGLGPRSIERVIGVCKAYTTRVGAGPFPTEQPGPDGDLIRERGHEYGTTTGRPRRCGWLDAVMLRTAAALNSATGLAVMLLDVLNDFETVPVCVAYEAEGRRYECVPGRDATYAACRPVYEELPGWTQPIADCRRWEDLPDNARRYLDRMSELVGVPIAAVSVGPSREQTVVLDL